MPNLKPLDYVYIPTLSTEPLMVFDSKTAPVRQLFDDYASSEKSPQITHTQSLFNSYPLCALLQQATDDDSDNSSTCTLVFFDERGKGSQLSLPVLTFFDNEDNLPTLDKIHLSNNELPKIRLAWLCNEQNRSTLSQVFELAFKPISPSNHHKQAIISDLATKGHCLCRVNDYLEPNNNDPLEVITGFDTATGQYKTATAKRYAYALKVEPSTGLIATPALTSPSAIITQNLLEPQISTSKEIDELFNTAMGDDIKADDMIIFDDDEIILDNFKEQKETELDLKSLL